MIFGVSSGYRAQNGARARKTETCLKMRHAFTGEHPQAVVSQLDKNTKTAPGHGGAARQRDLRGSVDFNVRDLARRDGTATLIIASVHYSIALNLLHTRRQETYFYYENLSTRFRNSKMFRLRWAKIAPKPHF